MRIKNILKKLPIIAFISIFIFSFGLTSEDVLGAATGYHDEGHDWNHTSWNSSSDCGGCTAVSGKTNCSTCGASGKVTCTTCNGNKYTEYTINSSGTINGQTWKKCIVKSNCSKCGNGSTISKTYYNFAGNIITSVAENPTSATGKIDCSTCNGDGALNTTCARCNGQGWNYKCTNTTCAQNYDNSWDYWTSESGYNPVCYTVANTYSVVYNKNNTSATGTMSSSSHTYDTSKNLSSVNYSLTGYTFSGWATSSTGNVVYSNGQSVKNLTSTNGGTVNLYAKWTANKYTVSYNANGGSGSMSSTSHTYGTSSNLRANAYTRTGYIFQGWSTSSSATVASYTDKAAISTLTSTNNATVTLYAVWKPISYTIKYNGGIYNSGSTTNQTVNYGTAFNLSANGYIKTGYTFKGWSTSSTSSTVTYNNMQSVSNLTSTNNATINLYAVWSPNTYTITYDGNGATSGSMSSSTHTYDTEKNLSSNIYFKDGYDFLGWSTSYNATTPTYTDKQSVKNLKTAQGDDLKLFAVWKIAEREITYDANGGTFADGSISLNKTYIVYDSVDLSIAPLVPGYNFVGWALHPTEGAPIDSYEMPYNNTTLYARYSIPVSGLTQTAYFVIWNANTSATTNKVQFDVPVKKETVYGYDYAISGLNTTMSALGVNVKGAFFVYDNANNYEIITFTNNGDPQTDGVNVPVIPTIYTQTTYYKFYNIAAEEYTTIKLEEDIMEGVLYTPLQNLPVTLDKVDYKMPDGYFSTLKYESTTGLTSPTEAYIVTGDETQTYTMQPKKYIVTLDSNGGEVKGTPTYDYEVTYTDYYGSLPTPTKEGYTFLGWYTENSTTPGITNGTLISSTDIYNIPDNSTLYAAWEANTYQLVFDYATNGGLNPNKEPFKVVDIKFDSIVTANAIAEDGIRDGWVFVGWSSNPTATKADPTFNMIVPDNGEYLTLFAIYSRTYDYTFIDKDGNSIVSLTLYNKETMGTITTPYIREFAEWKAVGWTTTSVSSEQYEKAHGEEIEIYDTSLLSMTYYAIYYKDISVSFVVPDECNYINAIEEKLYYNVNSNETVLDFTLPEPSKREKYSFVGWERNDGAIYYLIDKASSSDWKFKTIDTLVFTSIWNAKPTISVTAHYFTLEEALNGVITKDTLLKDIEANDKEDGSINDNINILNFNASEYTSLTGGATFSVIYNVFDSFGHIVEKSSSVYISDTTTREEPMQISSRFITNEYFNTSELSLDEDADGYVDGIGNKVNFGGLADESVWKNNIVYKTVLASALENRDKKEAISGMKYTFKKNDIESIKEYVKTYGFANFYNVSGRLNFIELFMK